MPSPFPLTVVVSLPPDRDRLSSFPPPRTHPALHVPHGRRSAGTIPPSPCPRRPCIRTISSAASSPCASFSHCPPAHRRRLPRRSPQPRRSSGCRWWSCTSRSEEHTSELQSLMRISYAVFCLKKKK